jgi:hypothetical protein
MSKKGFNEYKICGDYTIIYLRGQHSNKYPITIIDTEDLQKLINIDISWNVHLEVHKKFYYVLGTQYLGTEKPKNKSYNLHRFVMEEKDKNIKIDHIDGDNFNNRKSNLRRTSQKNNLRHRKMKNSNNKSGYRNVCKINNCWVIQLQINGKNTRLKSFPLDQLEEAGKYAEEMRKKYYGDFSGKS